MSQIDLDGPIPSRIGPYRILERIGEGGMGVVYLAEQDHPHRQVALKVIRADSYSPKHLRRFEHEAEMLGRLQHPGIAQIYQAGTHATTHGMQPYFAMEYVRGTNLDQYARERRLRTHARLELAAKICDAVEHAHQKGVIHRDLKPGNILITEDGQPKILDFGVARINDADLRSSTLHTDIGVLVGTLTYMSPEQASGDPDQLDTRSDVYSLGVVFFELLTGQLPYRIDRRMVPESVRVIREEEPSRLSTHDRTLRGDVETIVAKTLEKDKARRYSSASALAADIRRYLADEPISARPPSAGYQLGKFARRNKVLVGGVAAFVLALVAGTIVAWTQAQRARSAERTVTQQLGVISSALARATESEKEALAQRDRANAAEQLALDRLNESQVEQRKAEQSAAFLESLFSGINPHEAQGADTTLLRRILASGAARISSELAGQPEVEVSIRQALGSAYSCMSEFDEAETHLRRAQTLAREHFGEDDRRTLAVDSSIATLLFFRGEHFAAEELGRRTLERQVRNFGASDRDAIFSRMDLGDTLGRIGRYIESEATLRETLDLAQGMSPPDPEMVDRSKFSLALALFYRGLNEEAEKLYREVADDRRARLGEEDSSTLEAFGNLAMVVLDLGRFEEAEGLQRRVLAGMRRVYGPESLQTLNVLNNLAVALEAQDKLEEAEAVFRECLETRRRALPPRHPDVLRSLSVLSRLCYRQGRYEEALSLVEEALEGQRATLGEDHEDTMFSKFFMAALLKEHQRYAEAAKMLGEIADHERRTRGEADPTVGRSLYNMAGTLQDDGDQEGAERVMREVLELRAKHGWEDEPYTAAVVNGLAKVLEGRGEHDEADRLYEEALEMRRGFGDGEVVHSLFDYGEALLDRGDLEGAEPLLRELNAIAPKVYRPERWELPTAKAMLGHCLARQGRFAEAEPLLKAACERLANDPTAKPSVRQKALEWITAMYADWDGAEPGSGRAEQAALWRARASPPEE